jgi:hypothetical protein
MRLLGSVAIKVRRTGTPVTSEQPAHSPDNAYDDGDGEKHHARLTQLSCTARTGGPRRNPAVTHGGHVAQGGAAAANDPDDRGDLKGADC